MINIDHKKIRKITGYTFVNQKRNPQSWLECALAFNESANILFRIEKQTTKGNIVTIFNAAISIELILKAILAAQNKSIKKIHNLRILSEDARVNLNDDQKYLLDYLTETIIWLKYPVPNSEEKWNEFHDVKFEELVIRSKAGNTFKVMANLKRIPSLENYKNLWDICLAKYDGLPAR